MIETYAVFQNLWEATEFWSAIVGAIVGGAITIIANIMERRHQARAEQELVKRRHQVLSQSLFIKIMRLHADFDSHREHFDIKKFDLSNGHDEYWTQITPLAVMPSVQRFTIDELSMVLMWREFDEFHRLLELEKIHEISLELLRLFTVESRNLRGRLLSDSEKIEIQGLHVSADVGVSPGLRLRMNEINDLIRQIFDILSSGEAKALVALSQIKALIERNLGERIEFKLVKN